MRTEKVGKVLGVIPVRIGSTRLERKPLQDVGGQTLIERVWRCALEAETLSKVVVATDSEEIAQVVSGFGGEVLMTDPAITTGTQRVAAVAGELSSDNWDTIVNVQGDMPFLPGELIDRVVCFYAESDSRYAMATGATPIQSEESWLSSSDVKVVVNPHGDALYFSRSPIPFSRDGVRLDVEVQGRRFEKIFGLRHFGLYVFSPEALGLYLSAEFSPLEEVERLEQLRLLDQGLRIGVCIIEPELTAGFVEVDTPEDLEKARGLVE